MKIDLLINNKNNRLGRILPKLEYQFGQSNLGTIQFRFTEKRKHAIELAKEACNQKCDYIIAIGGDGTLNEVVNGILNSNKKTEDYPVLGLLPYGSANDFARTANISRSIEDLISLIKSKSIKEIDIGKIALESNGEIRYFINIAGIGLGPEVVESIDQSKNILTPGLDYFRHIIKCFLKYEKKEVTCEAENWTWKGNLLQMAVANAKYFGNAICIAPDAKLDDGLFQVSIFGNLSVWDYLINLPKLKKGIKINHSEVKYFTAKEIRIGGQASCGIEADGEYVGTAPARIGIMHKKIQFLMPSHS